MGLLDDAIREHLELKRQHGADPAEVARQEREALGPPRGAEPEGPEELGPEDVAAEPGQVDEIDEPPAGDAAGAPEEDPWLEEDEERSPPPEPEPEAQSEDVLEETPEFLQETPE